MKESGSLQGGLQETLLEGVASQENLVCKHWRAVFYSTILDLRPVERVAGTTGAAVVTRVSC